MGYSNVTTLIYGVELDQVQMKALIAALRKASLYELGLVPAVDLELVGYTRCPWTLYDAEIKSQDSDSRVDSMVYDKEIAKHVFGINCGHGEVFKKQGKQRKSCTINFSKMVDVIRHVPEKAVKNFLQYCLPVLIEAGIEVVPDIILVNQVAALQAEELAAAATDSQQLKQAISFIRKAAIKCEYTDDGSLVRSLGALQKQACV